MSPPSCVPRDACHRRTAFCKLEVPLLARSDNERSGSGATITGRRHSGQRSESCASATLPWGVMMALKLYHRPTLALARTVLCTTRSSGGYAISSLVQDRGDTL